MAQALHTMPTIPKFGYQHTQNITLSESQLNCGAHTLAHTEKKTRGCIECINAASRPLAERQGFEPWIQLPV